MRNSKTKHIRNTVSTPFIDYNTYTQQKPSLPQTFSPRVIKSKNEVFESNYNFFLKRMEVEKPTNGPYSSKGYQRYASMDSSRVQ